MKPRIAAFTCMLVFAIAGPPVGGLVAWLMMGLPNLTSPVPFVLGAWEEGGVLALGVGFLMALADWRGYRTWRVPVIVALLASVGFILLTTDLPSLPRVALVLVPPAIVASLACWWLMRRLSGR